MGGWPRHEVAATLLHELLWVGRRQKVSPLTAGLACALVVPTDDAAQVLCCWWMACKFEEPRPASLGALLAAHRGAGSVATATKEGMVRCEAAILQRQRPHPFVLPWRQEPVRRVVLCLTRRCDLADGWLYTLLHSPSPLLDTDPPAVWARRIEDTVDATRAVAAARREAAVEGPHGEGEEGEAVAAAAVAAAAVAAAEAVLLRVGEPLRLARDLEALHHGLGARSTSRVDTPDVPTHARNGLGRKRPRGGTHGGSPGMVTP